MADHVLWTLTDGDVVVEATATVDAGGNVTFTFELVAGLGDINGLFIDIGNDGGAITDLGGGVNMQGAGDGFDFAVALGSGGGNDPDVTMGTVTGFTLTDLGVADLEELATAELGFRLKSVGEDREGSLKLLAVGEYVPDFVADPDLSVTKMADVTSVSAAGQEITYIYEVENTGNVTLTGVTLVDDNFTAGDTGDDVVPDYESGDTNGNSTLDVGETWVYKYTHTVKQEEIDAGVDLVNVVTADSDQTDEATADETVDVVQTPGLSVTKKADVTSVSVAGQEITYTYEVENTGNVTLTGVTLVDDNFTAGDTGDDVVPDYESGDTNGNSTLDVGETWVYTHIHTVEQEEIDAGVNLVNVVTADSDQTDEDTADEMVEVVQTPGLSVIKTADIHVAAAGDKITYTYEIANTGNMSLTGVTLVDDSFTPGDTGDDVIPLFTGGDTDLDGKLDVDEVWTYTASHTVTEDEFKAGADLVNVATADSDQTGEETDNETVEIAKAGIEIEKLIKANGEWYEADGDAELLKLLATEGKLEYKIVVTNTGNVDLTEVEVWDPHLGIPQWCAIDVGTIEVGGNVVLTAKDYSKLEVCWSEGEVLNRAFADSLETDEVSDDANYFGAVVCLNVDKVTIDAEGNTGDDLVVAAGEAIKWQYTLSNNGNVAIAFSDFTFFDDNGTWDEGDDWTIGLTNYISGDTNNNLMVDPDENWVFEKEGVAIDGDLCDDEGRYSNYAIVSLDYEDDAGLTRTYNALDTSSYTLEGYEGGQHGGDGHPDGDVCDDDDDQPDGPPDGEVCDDDDDQPDGDGPQDGDFCDEDGHNDDDGQLGGGGHYHGSHDGDHLIGCTDDEWFYGRDGDDWMSGKGGKDHFHGERGRDEVFGGRGGDHIHGGRGKDKLYGEKGKDHIEGGRGHDKMWGGDGCDTFKFGDGDGRDKIFDFDAHSDKHDIIDLCDVSDIGGWKDLKNNHLQEVDKGIWIHSDNVEIFLKGVEWADLDKGDFCF